MNAEKKVQVGIIVKPYFATMTAATMGYACKTGNASAWRGTMELTAVLISSNSLMRSWEYDNFLVCGFVLLVIWSKKVN